MINNIQSTFNIQDLENLSGIKAHTIRIWEKRYKLLNPTRLNRNIRVYNILDLKKILNISLLQKHNYKISELAKYADIELSELAKSISQKSFSNNYHINSLLISMYSFDEELFEEVYQNQIKAISFSEIFEKTYLPLLHHIGLLWQTSGINPAQEHFISNLIYQKIALHIAQLPVVENKEPTMNILFLPEGEMHEIALYYHTYVLKQRGQKAIYLGRSIPFSDLFNINSKFKYINWITYFLIDITNDEKKQFIENIEELLLHTKNRCTIVGSVWNDFTQKNLSSNIFFYEGFDQIE